MRPRGWFLFFFFFTLSQYYFASPVSFLLHYSFYVIIQPATFIIYLIWFDSKKTLNFYFLSLIICQFDISCFFHSQIQNFLLSSYFTFFSFQFVVFQWQKLDATTPVSLLHWGAIFSDINKSAFEKKKQLAMTMKDS